MDDAISFLDDQRRHEAMRAIEEGHRAQHRGGTAFRPQPVSRVSSCRMALRSQLANRDASCLILLSRRLRRWPWARPASGPAVDQRVDQHRHVLRIVLAVAVDGGDNLPALAASAPDRNDRLWPAERSWRMWRSMKGRAASPFAAATRGSRRSSRHRPRSPRTCGRPWPRRSRQAAQAGYGPRSCTE